MRFFFGFVLISKNKERSINFENRFLSSLKAYIIIYVLLLQYPNAKTFAAPCFVLDIYLSNNTFGCLFCLLVDNRGDRFNRLLSQRNGSPSFAGRTSLLSLAPGNSFLWTPFCLLHIRLLFNWRSLIFLVCMFRCLHSLNYISFHQLLTLRNPTSKFLLQTTSSMRVFRSWFNAKNEERKC